MGVKILGTKAEDVDAAEDRELFDEILEKTRIPRAAGGTVFTAEEAKEVANASGLSGACAPVLRTRRTGHEDCM